jgi:hypothetical protein
MMHSFLIGLLAGQRGITPLAVIATVIRRREIPLQLPLQKLLLNPVIAAGAAALAAAEMAGDKMKTAPDRIVPVVSRFAALLSHMLVRRWHRGTSEFSARWYLPILAGACAVRPCCGMARQLPVLPKT